MDPPFGFGHLLHYGRELSAMDQVIKIILIVVIIRLITDKSLFALWGSFMHRRWGAGAVQ
jgi:NitT/TauT family transport system permease protein